MFQIGDLSSFLAGGLTCIRRGDLFIKMLYGVWSSLQPDHETNNSISIKFNLFKFTADHRGKGPHFCLTLDKITFRLMIVQQFHSHDEFQSKYYSITACLSSEAFDIFCT